MLLFVAADVVLRFTSLDWLTFRGLEASWVRFPGSDGPFTPNKVYFNPVSYGDLASISNLPQFREVHPALFRTDDHGFHNPPAYAASLPAAGILTGDSFSINAEVPEDQTLAALLGQALGGFVYNAADDRPLSTWAYAGLATRLGMSHGVVIVELLERQEAAEVTRRPGEYSSLARKVGQQRWVNLYRILLNQARFSPITAIAKRLEKLVENDTMLPNGFASAVEVKKLRNGLDILLLRPFPPAAAGKAQRWADYFSRLRQQLAGENLDLVVALVPEKRTTYAPLFNEPSRDDAGPVYLNDLEAKLRGGNIKVVNLLGPLRRLAEEELSRGNLVFWRDDTHWNARGIKLASEKIAEVVRDNRR